MVYILKFLNHHIFLMLNGKIVGFPEKNVSIENDE